MRSNESDFKIPARNLKSKQPLDMKTGVKRRRGCPRNRLEDKIVRELREEEGVRMVQAEINYERSVLHGDRCPNETF